MGYVGRNSETEPASILGKIMGWGLSVTVDCILSECVVTDVQLGNNPCERRFSVLTFLRAVGFSAAGREE
jgi:hypothetical protein